MKIASIIIALLLGILVVVGCAPVQMAEAAQKASDNGSKIALEQMKQEDIPYAEGFLMYYGADRDVFQKKLGIPTFTTKSDGKLCWTWQSITNHIDGKKDVQAQIMATFENDNGKEARTAKELMVTFYPDFNGKQYAPLGSNCATVIDKLKDRKFYAKTFCESDNEYYIVGTLNGVNVSIVNHSSVWPLVSEPSIDENGLRKETLKTNPGFDWKVGHVVSITMKPRPKSGESYLGTVKTPEEGGLLKLVEGI